MALPMATPDTRPDPADRTARIIRALLGMTGLYEKDLAAHLGWSAPTMSKALKGRRQWKMPEIEAVAEFFEVPVSVMFMDPGELLDRVRTGRFPMLGLPTPPQLELPFTSERTLTVVGSAP